MAVETGLFPRAERPAWAGPGRGWRFLLGAVVLVVLFVPIRRYALPGGLTVEVEPYRVLSAVAIAGWATALLLDRRVRLRATSLEAPIALFLAVALASLLVNPDRLDAVAGEIAKRAGLAAGLLVTLYLVVSVVRGLRDAELLCRLLVAGGALVGLLAVIESRTGSNVFNLLPLPLEREYEAIREGEVRAYASAQHPIALGAALILLLPVAVHLAQFAARRRWLWWAAAGVLLLGAVATVSRTTVLMLGVVLLVLAWLRPGAAGRLTLGVVLLTSLALLLVPNMLGALEDAFFPKQGIVAEQEGLAGGRSSGRLADIDPSLEKLGRKPLLGHGFGTRVTGGERENALLLDNQWLGTTIETGVVGAFALGWVFVRFMRRAGREARRNATARGSLLAALAASAAAYAVSMATYDAFAFIQVTFVLVLLLGLGCALLPAAQRRATTSKLAGRL